jgi:hypothetical protein
MKVLWDILPSAVKAVFSVCAFMIGMGWGSYVAIDVMTSGKVRAATDSFKEIRNNDMDHINGRFDRVNARFDRTDAKLDDIMKAIQKR